MAQQRIEGYNPMNDSLIGRTATAAIDSVCQLDAGYPGFTRNDWGIPGFGEMQGKLLDTLCGGRPGYTPHDPPANLPFQGGQCENRAYRMVIQGILIRDPSNIQQVDTYCAWGPIRTVRSGATANANGNVEVLCKGTFLRNNPNPSPPRPFGWWGTGIITTAFQAESSQRRWRIAGIIPVDLKPDTCGDPPPEYEPTPLPPGVTNSPITVNISPGVNITVPFAYIPIRPELNFNPQLSFAPSLEFNAGGLNFHVDAGGITVNFPDPVPNPLPIDGYPGYPYPRPVAPSPPPPISGDGATVVCPDCPPCPPCPGGEPPTGTPVTRPPTDGADEEVPGISYLEVLLTKLPNKWQSGNGAEAVYYAGWVAFRGESGAYHPRQPIHFEKNMYQAPPGASGYTVTFTNLAEGQVRYYTKEEV